MNNRTADVPLTHTSPPFQVSAEVVLERLQTRVAGLSEAEATERLQRHGANRLQVRKPVSAWIILLDQFRSVVVALLVVAAAVALVVGEPLEAAAVFGVLVINAAIGFFTELRARSAMHALLRLAVPTAIVRRAGEPQHVDAASLVPGDIILLESGQAVPADARLVSATELTTIEAALTGESLPVEKRAAEQLDPDTPLADRVNSIYMATAVATGTGVAVVTATGMDTEVGRIGARVGEVKQERTPLEQKLDALGRRLVWVTLGIALVVVGLGFLRNQPLGELIETALALAIAAVPEGLPAVSTIALAIGVARMARRNALVRRLPAVEALGSATVICTDKTGTLTAGRMSVTAMWVAGREYTAVTRADDDVLALALRVGALANRATIHDSAEAETRFAGDPTEVALLAAAQDAGVDRAELLQRFPEIAELPFSSERMIMATLHRGPDGHIAHVKGAPAHIIERSARITTHDGPVPLTEAARQQLVSQNRAMAQRGLRVLALAVKQTDTMSDDALRDLDFVGFVGMSDPPAAGVKETIARFHDAGIRTVMITGDQLLTAQAIARDLGIAESSVYSRVSPEDKLRIVDELQKAGEIVAMLGDGVNDAPALKKADIGVAMGMRGTDVAKDAAAVVLQDDRFQTIGAAVEEGRVIYDNIRKFVFYLFSCNVAEILVILVAGIAGLPQPLLPLQILWLNLVTDTFPALSLAAEPAEPNVMQRPPQDPQRAILSRDFLLVVLWYGALITAVTLAAFVWALNDQPDARARAITIAFMTLALAQTFHLGNARGGGPALRLRRIVSNRWALRAVLLTVALQFAALYVRPVAHLLGVVPLSLRDWMVVLAAAALPAVVGQLIAYRKSHLAPRA